MAGRKKIKESEKRSERLTFFVKKRHAKKAASACKKVITEIELSDYEGIANSKKD